jgi:hypothetical protein
MLFYANYSRSTSIAMQGMIGCKPLAVRQSFENTRDMDVRLLKNVNYT